MYPIGQRERHDRVGWLRWLRFSVWERRLRAHCENGWTILRRRIGVANDPGTPIRIVGGCKMTGSCCRNLILVDRGRPIRSEKSWRRLRKREPEYEMFVPNERTSSDGLMRFHCQNQGGDNRCRIYASRPEICRSYPEPEMFARGGGLLPGCGYRLVAQEEQGTRFERALQRALENPKDPEAPEARDSTRG